MEYNAKTGSIESIRTNCLILGVFEQRQLSSPAREADLASKGMLKTALRRGDMAGKPGDLQMLYDVPGIKANRVLLVGLGSRKESNSNSNSMAVSVGKAVSFLNQGGSLDAVFALPHRFLQEKPGLYLACRQIVLESEQQVYLFDSCKSIKEPIEKPLKKLALLVADGKQQRVANKALIHGHGMAQGIKLAKDLANLPGNICTPGYLAEKAKKIGRKSEKLKVSVLNEKSMEQLGMGALLSVSRGSRQPAKLIVMEYNGGKANARPVVLVGKGLTFDAGGISIKPGENMDEMKYDMCGGASVFGTIAMCIELDLPINVVGVVPASENLPDGDANKPGDIVTSMAGLTIEVLNTDAEGRLILCDALTYAARFKPAVVIDIATLTGACVVALGHHKSGLLSNDDKLVAELLDAGVQANDPAWQLPLGEEYQQQLNSNFADMANIGGRAGGTITAACFLSRFTKDYKWAHLDIAGTAWKSGNDKGATGRPVSLLSQMLLKRCSLVE